MFGSIGGAEFLLILVLALLLFGPRKLPQIGRSVGRALAEFRNVSHEFKASLDREVELDQVLQAKDGLAAAAHEATDAVQEVASVARGSLLDAPGGSAGDGAGRSSPDPPPDAASAPER